MCIASYHVPEGHEGLITPQDIPCSFLSPLVIPTSLPHWPLVVKPIPVQGIDQIKLVAILVEAVDMEPWALLPIATDKVPYRGITPLEVEADPELRLERFHVGVEAEAVFVAKLVNSGELARQVVRLVVLH